jgi:hypothetical protein
VRLLRERQPIVGDRGVAAREVDADAPRPRHRRPLVPLGADEPVLRVADGGNGIGAGRLQLGDRGAPADLLAEVAQVDEVGEGTRLTLVPPDDGPPVTVDPDEEAGVLKGITEIAAGRGIPMHTVRRELRRRT